MLSDVEFPIFAPSKEWSEGFKKLDYDVEAVEKQFGSPLVSNQHPDLKITEGVYYTDLNPESYFTSAGLKYIPPYNTGFDEAHKAWNLRKERDLKFISLFDIANMYKLAMFGDTEHTIYGVCDNHEQILKEWPHLEKSTQRHFITMTPIHRKHQPSEEGWRWHKWGEYIGEHEIQHEYLYDEKDIDVVYVFHIFTLTSDSGLGSMPIKEETA